MSDVFNADGKKSSADSSYRVVIRVSTRENAESVVEQITFAMERAGLIPYVMEIEGGGDE